MTRLTQIWMVVLLLVGRYAVAEDVRYNFDFPDFETYVADAEQTPAEQAGDQHQPAEHTDSPEAVNHQQNVKVEGFIKARSGQNMILQTPQNPDLVVELTDSTDVGQVQGMLKARNKSMSMAALIPGLAVK